MLTLVALAGGDCIDDADVTGGTACTLGHGQGAIHPGHLPAQLPVGPRPSTRPGEPRVAGPGLAMTIDLDSTICRPTDWLRRAHAPRLYRQAGLPPAADRRRHRNVLMSRPRGPGQHRAAPPTSCGRRWDGCATPGPTDDSRYGPTAGSTLMAWFRLPDGCPLLHHHPPAQKPAHIRGDTRSAWTPIPYWMDGAADVAETTSPPSRPRRTPRRYGESRR